MLTLVPRLVLASLLLFAGLAFADEEHALTYFPYANTKDYGKFLISRFKPEECLFVGLGRSPTPIIAFLQEYALLVDSHIKAVNFPFSVRSILMSETLLKQAEQNFSQHVRRFVSQSVLDSGKTIVLFDYAESGGTLTNATLLFRQFLKNEGYKNEVVPVAAMGEHAVFEDIQAEEVRIAGPLDEDFFLRSYKNYAEYESYKIAGKGERFESPVGPRPEYLKLRAAVRKIMLNDPHLRTPFDFGIFQSHDPKNQNKRLSCAANLI